MLEEVVFACVGLVAVVDGSIWAGGLEGRGKASRDDKSGVGCSVERIDKYVVLRSLILRVRGRRWRRRSGHQVNVVLGAAMHAENTRLLT